ncbi:hypothetical protein Y032_0413g1000 [Ancylostoma ceylanicum]|uniref:Uncharacterized protein n=1 Tax=Ancylostoma ceylanicum TaxID=53326 RepID=A0A016X2Z4_9BILA|nr:hypothetical protein Y032_0413g1000 [Ancylostoma ceylanicum]
MRSLVEKREYQVCTFSQHIPSDCTFTAAPSYGIRNYSLSEISRGVESCIFEKSTISCTCLGNMCNERKHVKAASLVGRDTEENRYVVIFPLPRVVQQTTRVGSARFRPLSTAVWSSLYLFWTIQHSFS